MVGKGFNEKSSMKRLQLKGFNEKAKNAYALWLVDAMGTGSDGGGGGRAAFVGIAVYFLAQAIEISNACCGPAACVGVLLVLSSAAPAAPRGGWYFNRLHQFHNPLNDRTK